MLNNKLDSKGTYSRLDKSNLYRAVVAVPDQINVAWNEIKLLPNTDQRSVNKIVVAGMGGSALGARIIKAWSTDRMKVPLEIATDYHLPAYVDDRTWVILSSYSGTTEETIAAGEEALERGARVAVLCTGGDLARMAKERGWQAYIFEPMFNPGNMPRMAIGYNCLAMLALISKEGYVNVTDQEIEELVNYLKSTQLKLLQETASKDNAAKKMASKIAGKGVLLIGARHLSGAIHAFKNQLNENAKTFAVYFEVPELNHHLMEGLLFPKELKKNLEVIIFESDLYEQNIQKRMLLTEEVLAKQGYKTTRIKPEGRTELMQVWETIQFGEFVSFYTAILNDLDPAPIVWVDYFKKRIKEI